MRIDVSMSNRLPTPAASGEHGGVPYTLLNMSKADLSYLKV
jgi:hypothetical protein